MGVLERHLYPQAYNLVMLAVKIIAPLIILAILSVFYSFTSILLYVWMRYYLIPRELIAEPVYFNYNNPQPTAKVNILSHQQQWEYISDNYVTKNVQNKDYSRFLRGTTSYAVSVDVLMALSERNKQTGTFMMSLTMVDRMGYATATSSRPVTIPYQSFTSLFLDSVAKFPLRVLGLVDPIEGVRIQIDLMNDFVEPLSPHPPTETIEIAISSHAVDILSSTVTVVPKLEGITYYLYYHPKTSLLISVGVFTAIQLIATICFAFWIYILRVIYIMSHGGESDDTLYGDGSNYRTAAGIRMRYARSPGSDGAFDNPFFEGNGDDRDVFAARGSRLHMMQSELMSSPDRVNPLSRRRSLERNPATVVVSEGQLDTRDDGGTLLAGAEDHERMEMLRETSIWLRNKLEREMAEEKLVAEERGGGGVSNETAGVHGDDNNEERGVEDGGNDDDDDDDDDAEVIEWSVPASGELRQRRPSSS
jgi:hypothetical protein